MAPTEEAAGGRQTSRQHRHGRTGSRVHAIRSGNGAQRGERRSAIAGAGEAAEAGKDPGPKTRAEREHPARATAATKERPRTARPPLGAAPHRAIAQSTADRVLHMLPRGGVSNLFFTNLRVRYSHTRPSPTTTQHATGRRRTIDTPGRRAGLAARRSSGLSRKVYTAWAVDTPQSVNGSAVRTFGVG